MYEFETPTRDDNRNGEYDDGNANLFATVVRPEASLQDTIEIQFMQKQRLLSNCTLQQAFVVYREDVEAEEPGNDEPGPYGFRAYLEYYEWPGEIPSYPELAILVREWL